MVLLLVYFVQYPIIDSIGGVIVVGVANSGSIGRDWEGTKTTALLAEVNGGGNEGINAGGGGAGEKGCE